jgi:DNA-binding transcriptional regulator GbsR (MarR family)
MMDSPKPKEKVFIEEVGMVFERKGFPRMAGRILGWLLICEPSHQSHAEMAEALQASKGSISTTLRLLEQIGMIVQYMVPGERHVHYCLRKETLPGMVAHNFEDELKIMKNLVEHGLEIMKEKNSERCQWMEQMRDHFAFMEREMPALMERYHKNRTKT